jgi:AcrR family transcriptional regulator
MRAMRAAAVKTADPRHRTVRVARTARPRLAAVGRRRELDSAALREKILAVATEEFGVRGYKGTNLRHVATRLGMTRQALYHYFPHKHDILVALFGQYFDELEANVVRASAGVAPADQFRSMMRSHIALMAARPGISRVFEREDGEVPARAALVVRKRRRALHAVFVEAYEAGAKAGTLRPADAKLVVSIMLGVPGWLHRWYKMGGRLKPAELAAEAEELLFDGVKGSRGRRANGL